MVTWQDFEKDCCNFLNREYGSKYKKLEALGGSDSTQPDIKITTNKSSTFYIEVKKPIAQSGQFVLLPDEEKKQFIFSPKNITANTCSTKKIIEYMNNNYYDFKSAGKKGKSINMDEKIFRRWIIDHYQSKEVKYFITKGSDFIIFPISEIEIYFHITATYRIKKSGSSEPSANCRDKLVEFLRINCNMKKNDVQLDKKKLIVKVINIPFKDNRFIMGDYTYRLAPIYNNKKDAYYEVRKLSNTCNMNVIFSLTLKDPETGKFISDSFSKEFEN